MINYVFLLSKEDINLARAEVISIIPNSICKLENNLLFVNPNKKLDVKNLQNRLAYTNKIYQFLFSSSKNQLEKNISKFNWNKIYQKSIAVRYFQGLNKKNIDKEKELAFLILKQIKTPKVNLSKPKTLIHVYKIKEKYYFLLSLEENKGGFEERKC